MASSINRVTITGNLTRDPEVRALSSGTTVCSLRVACNGRRRNQQTQEWEDVPNYFDVTVWGAHGDNCGRYLSKGRGIAVDGRLQWREWTDGEGNKRQAVDIVAENVQFLGGGNGETGTPRFSSPIDTGDFDRSPTGGSDDDIPF
jgi:single-strand DNA-binding protein